jgi:hypothetical protein
MAAYVIGICGETVNSLFARSSVRDAVQVQQCLHASIKWSVPNHCWQSAQATSKQTAGTSGVGSYWKAWNKQLVVGY